MRMTDLSITLLTKTDVANLATIKDFIEAMEAAFLNHANGKSIGTGMLHFDAEGDVEFHLKAGGLTLEKTYFGLKINGASFTNATERGLPNIIGAIMLCDGTNGRPLALLDSIGITVTRTGATTAVAAKYLARKDSRAVTICGCGTQGRVHAAALLEVFPGIEIIHACDTNAGAVAKFATEIGRELAVDVVPATDRLQEAVQQSDIVITCTPSKQAFLLDEYIAPGTFIGAIGADSPSKRELDGKILSRAKLVTDITAQCAQVGELHHAIDEGLVTIEKVHGELGAVIAGMVRGRESDDEIFVYDATGTALQDVAAAAMCYQKALTRNVGTSFNLYE